jgi:hypothetical protein
MAMKKMHRKATLFDFSFKKIRKETAFTKEKGPQTDSDTSAPCLAVDEAQIDDKQDQSPTTVELPCLLPPSVAVHIHETLQLVLRLMKLKWSMILKFLPPSLQSLSVTACVKFQQERTKTIICCNSNYKKKKRKKEKKKH